MADSSSVYATGKMDPKKTETFKKLSIMRESQRRKEIAEALRVVEEAEQVDLVFLMDCTASMTRYIDECKQKIDIIFKNYRQC